MLKMLVHGYTFVSAVRAERVGVLEPVRQGFRAWPWWCDFLGHVNHAKYLELASLGRFAWITRAGLLRESVRQGCIFVIGGAALTYRREIPRMSAFVVETQVVGYDDDWLTFSTTFLRRRDGVEQIAARAMVRGQVRRRDSGAMNMESLVRQLGVEPPPSPVAPADIAAQIEAQAAAIGFIRAREGRRVGS